MPPPTPPPTPPTETPRRQVPLVVVGGVAALLAGGVVAWGLTRGDAGDTTPPPASEAGLVIDFSASDDGRIDPAKPLRCFVQGVFVGEISLIDCARRNGVATDALDVGIDESGALAAAQQAGQALIPLPPLEALPETPVETAVVSEPDAVAAPAPESCWRYGGARWRKLPGDLGLEACVQALFAGRCEKPGGASYGRWGQQTLRLVAGRVEASDDNRSFHTLASQGPDCDIAPIG